MVYDILAIGGQGGPPEDPILQCTDYSKPTIVYSPESRALQQSKNEINSFYQEGKWDDYKKITNPYEYIFLSWNRRSSRSVAIRQPLSRSYFKMIELWKLLDLTDYFRPMLKRGLRTAHAAEGPGGFIEACVRMAEKNQCMFESSFAITLRSDVKNIPGWRKAARFLENNPHIQIHDGADGTGNILKKENQDAFVQSVREKHPDGVHLFTADGGFDFSNDYNAQEDSVFPLLLAEAILGMRVLMKGGCLIIKCFDTIEQPTLDLLWLFSRSFYEWQIVKPRTSRAGNAERYFVGKGFLDSVDDVLGTLLSYQEAGIFTNPILNKDHGKAHAMMMAQVATLQEQIEHVEIAVIRETLDLIKTTEQSIIRKHVKANVVRSIQWCKEHDEEVSSGWNTEFEKSVQKEVSDLIQILNPPAVQPSHAYAKNTVISNVSFESFRSGVVNEVLPSANPFMRVKGKFLGNSG